MEDLSHIYQGKKFRSAEEELAFLREVVAKRESEEVTKKTREQSEQGEHTPEKIVAEYETSAEREKVIASEIRGYTKEQADRVLHEHFRMPEAQVQEIVLELTPETHDKQIEMLIARIYSEGILNVIQAVKAMNNPHLDDDFHRFLVQYIRQGLPTPGLKESAPEAKALHKILYEVSLPEKSEEGKTKSLKEIISSMEQFYSGMLSVSSTHGQGAHDENHFTVELSASEGSEEFVFYVSVPETQKQLFEKHFLAVYPDARVFEKKDDYNIFNADGVSVCSEAIQARHEIYPIKIYEQFDFDPLNVILNSFTHINKHGEGAAIQLVINPVGDYYTKEYKSALDEIRKGTKVKEAIDIRHTFAGKFAKAAGEVGKGFISEFSNKPKDKKDEGLKPIDDIAVEQITQKISAPIVETNIRIVTSAPNRDRAEQILGEIESTFNQFDNAVGNTIVFKRIDQGADERNFMHAYSYRLFNSKSSIPLSLKELNTIMHFPGDSITAQPQLKQSKSKTAPAPFDLPTEGLELGINNHRNTHITVHMAREDRLRHFYTIGQTGTGKSSFLRKMIIQDIKNGEGVCFIDPHGSDVQDILSHIPKERFDDVIYFDPSQTDRPMALNMLEYNRAFPEQKTFVVNELFSIFQKLYGAVPESMGPMFEQYFRNATMLVIEDPDSGSTLLDVSRVMSDKAFRDLKISRCKNPVVVQFWKEIAEKAGGEGALQNMVPYITSKFDVFLANDIMRPIIAQEKSSFNFRELMDSKKILLVNLAKGKLGDINSSLIGLILVGKILMAALSRVDSFGKDMPPFYLYIDEFQNITTPSIATILSEARKYKLSLTMAHQFIAQLDEKIKDAVFGNVGSMAVFRVGAEDAEFLVKQFEPVFSPHDLMNIDNMNCYLKMLSGGKPIKPFNIEFTWPSKGNERIVPGLKELSLLKYGSEREHVEADIMRKYQKAPTHTPTRAPIDRI